MTAADPLSGVEGRNKGIYPERTWLMTTVTAIPVPARLGMTGHDVDRVLATFNAASPGLAARPPV